MIAYVLLSAGGLGTMACAYYVTPASRGLHRFVVPRSKLRAEAAGFEAQAEELTSKLIGLAAELGAVTAEREEATGLLGKAELLVADLEDQLRAYDSTCAENTRLRAELANARAMRQLTADPSPADDASVLPDDVQEFVDHTADAWRATA